jgi:hypothetical protein
VEVWDREDSKIIPRFLVQMTESMVEKSWKRHCVCVGYRADSREQEIL